MKDLLLHLGPPLLFLLLLLPPPLLINSMSLLLTLSIYFFFHCLGNYFSYCGLSPCLSYSVLKCSLGSCHNYSPLRVRTCGSVGTGQAPVQGEKLLGFIGVGKTPFYQSMSQLVRVDHLFMCKVPVMGGDNYLRNRPKSFHAHCHPETECLRADFNISSQNLFSLTSGWHQIT